jgi:hypothetical protein
MFDLGKDFERETRHILILRSVEMKKSLVFKIKILLARPIFLINSQNLQSETEHFHTYFLNV